MTMLANITRAVSLIVIAAVSLSPGFYAALMIA